MEASKMYIAALAVVLSLISSRSASGQAPFVCAADQWQHPSAQLRKERIAAGLLIVDATGAQSTPDIAQGRELESYGRLGPLDGGRNFRTNRRAFTEAREFLWTHWNKHLKAYLIFTVHTVDATTTWHIFIEPDETDRWRLVWRLVRSHGRS